MPDLTPEQQAAAAAAATAQEPAPTPPAAVQPPAATPPATPPQPAPPSQGSTPWANDLSQAFPDEAQRNAVDQFLRGNVQPYVTKVEQEAREAKEFYQDFQSDPRQTYLDVTNDLFGEDVAKSVGDYLDLVQQAPPAQPTPPAERDPEIQAVIDWRKEQQEKAEYDQEFARVAAANPDLGLDPSNDLLRPFVAELGDFDQAAEAYRNYVAAIRDGYVPAPPPPDPTNDPAPPPTLGTEGGGPTPPPTQVEHKSVNDAIDAMFEQQRAEGKSVLPDPAEREPAPPVAA